MTLSPLPHPYPPTVFLYGGKVVQTRRMSDQMWALDLKHREWSRVNAGTGPGVRYFHSMDVCELPASPLWPKAVLTREQGRTSSSYSVA